MSLYISAESLEGAVSRLSESNARPTLCDFLIARHAMTQGDGTATLSLADDTYMSSVRAFAAVPTGPEEEQLPPYFNPFGTEREARKGWRSEKYPSNGPPVTLAGPGWKGVIEVITGRPRRVQLTPDYMDHLPKVIATADEQRPLLEDVALWYHRNKDIESAASERDFLVEDLIERFVAETGLSTGERAGIFEED